LASRSERGELGSSKRNCGRPKKKRDQKTQIRKRSRTEPKDSLGNRKSPAEDKKKKKKSAREKGDILKEKNKGTGKISANQARSGPVKSRHVGKGKGQMSATRRLNWGLYPEGKAGKKKVR